MKNDIQKAREKIIQSFEEEESLIYETGYSYPLPIQLIKSFLMTDIILIGIIILLVFQSGQPQFQNAKTIIIAIMMIPVVFTALVQFFTFKSLKNKYPFFITNKRVILMNSMFNTSKKTGKILNLGLFTAIPYEQIKKVSVYEHGIRVCLNKEISFLNLKDDPKITEKYINDQLKKYKKEP